MRRQWSKRRGRLAGNTLTEAVVFGKKVGEAAAAYAKSSAKKNFPAAKLADEEKKLGALTSGIQPRIPYQGPRRARRRRDQTNFSRSLPSRARVTLARESSAELPEVSAPSFFSRLRVLPPENSSSR